MEPVAISWLVASATSPLIAVLALWTVYVFHTYRKRWRSVDLFLLAIASQELVSAVFTFGFAIISLINPPIPALCSFIQWGMISIRTFQIATLTSMVVDRALTVRWPYRYRFSVRRNQIRYHIAVLALMAGLIGAGAVFAHHHPHRHQHGSSMVCSGHPGEWDFKYVVFSLGFYGILLLLALVCAIQIEVHKCRNGGAHEDKSRPFQLPDSPGSDLPVPTSVTSPLDNDSHTGSTKALHRPYRHSSRRPYNKKGNGNHSDFRWPPVAVVSLVCYSVNHLPYLVLTCLATVMPWVWSPWHEALLSWLRLAEGVLVPLILCLVDQPLRTALKRTFQRRSGALSPLVGDDGLFQMYFDKDHFRKRGTFGSVTPVGIITNYRRTPGKKRRTRKSKYKLPGLHSGDSVIEKSCLSGSFLSTEPLSKLSCADLTSLEVWQEEEEEENFYATLSDDFSNFSANSTDENALNEEAKMCEDLYGGSFTTIANDDFEFHDTRPCGGEVRMRPAMTVTVQPVNSFRSSTKSGGFIKEKFQKSELSKAPSSEKFTDLMTVALQPEEDKKDPNIFLTPDNTLDSEPDVVKRDEETTRSPASLSKATSYSMNDLDLIDNDNGAEKDKVFVLPVKSESTMSLYRLHLDKSIENFLTATKSEGHINGDSGFGSATQTMNPIWPGYPVHKVSDPLANHRKPVLSPGCASSKHYPCILHPRMQKIPWISAWRKLGGGGESMEIKKNRKCKDSDIGRGSDPALRTLLISDNFELRQREAFQWKDSIIYARDDAKKQVESSFPRSKTTDYNENAEAYLYGIPSEQERQTRSNSFRGEKCRKESFRELPKKPEEGHYGRINEKNSSLVLDESDEVSPSSEENIYEEIISSKPVVPTHSMDSVKKDMEMDDRCYAQTDILKLINVSNSPHDAEKRNTGRSNEFKLNISINPPLPVESIPLNGLPTLPEDSPINVSSLVVNCVPGHYEGDSPEFEENIVRKDKNKPEYNYNSRVHVAYNVNDSALEFIDKYEQNLCSQDPCGFGKEYVDEDFNANSPQVFLGDNHSKNCDFKIYSYGNNSQGEPKEVYKPRSRDANVKRRTSKKGRSDSNKSSDVKEVGSLSNHIPIARRDRSSQDKSRDIKKRESTSRNKRESNLPRRESDHRNKKPRCSSHQEATPQKKSEAASVHRNDSWATAKDYGRIPEYISRSRVARVKTCVQVDDPVTRSYQEHSGYGEIERVRRAFHSNHEGEFHPPDGVIRLHCNYPKSDGNQMHNANCVVASTSMDVVEPYAKESSRIQVQNRNFVNMDLADCSQYRTDYVQLYRNDSARERRTDKQKRYELDRKESDNRVKRKVSASRERRDQTAERKESFKDGSNGRRRMRRPDEVAKAASHVRRVNSFQTPRETNGNASSSVDEINRNESVKLNNEITLRDEHARMDNLVYGRRENANDTEIFPFETYVKPPSYTNLMKYNNAGDLDCNRDRCKQKKIAITDYL